MEWSSQSWFWLALVAGMFLMMRRGGHGGGCCGSSHSDHSHDKAGGRGTANEGGRTLPPAREGGRAEAARATDSASTDAEAAPTPAQDERKIHRHHGCC